MGMDYIYAGSASYPRFDDEMCEIARVFSGVECEEIRSRREEAFKRCPKNAFIVDYRVKSDMPRFTFPNGTDPVIVKWINDPYAYLSYKDTKSVWRAVSKHPEIKDISPQIWKELKLLVKYREGWSIW